MIGLSKIEIGFELLNMSITQTKRKRKLKQPW